MVDRQALRAEKGLEFSHDVASCKVREPVEVPADQIEPKSLYLGKKLPGGLKELCVIGLKAQESSNL